MYNTLFHISTQQFKLCVYSSDFAFEDVVWMLKIKLQQSQQLGLNFDQSPKQMLWPHCRHTLRDCIVVLKLYHTITMKNVQTEAQKDSDYAKQWIWQTNCHRFTDTLPCSWNSGHRHKQRKTPGLDLWTSYTSLFTVKHLELQYKNKSSLTTIPSEMFLVHSVLLVLMLRVFFFNKVTLQM